MAEPDSVGINIDSRHSVHNTAGRDQYNYNYFGNEQAHSLQRPSLSFNDAPIDLLSAHFIGREQDLIFISNAFVKTSGSTPSRCAIHGMPGLGKTQLALRYTDVSCNREQYTSIFWMSGATVEKVHQGLAKVLDLVGHPDRDHHSQITRLTAARRWLEQADDKWLLVIDNVSRDAVSFLREHLPRKNSRGNILFTTRTSDIAEAITVVAGTQHQTYELQAPNTDVAAKLFLSSVNVDQNHAVASSMATAVELVEYVGCLPLAIAQAATFVKQSGKSLTDLMGIYKSDIKYQVMNWENDLSPYEQRSVAATFNIQLDELERQWPDASDILKIISFLDPESIPLPLIVDGAKDILDSRPVSAGLTGFISLVSHAFKKQWGNSLFAVCADAQANQVNEITATSLQMEHLILLMSSPVKLHQAIQQLESLSLVSYKSDPDTHTLRIHDLIQATVRERVKQDNKSGVPNRWFHIAVKLACGAFRRVNDPRSPECWAQCEMVIQHFESLGKWAEEQGIRSPELMEANSHIADYLLSRGRCGAAQILYDAGREEQGGFRILIAQTVQDLEKVHRLPEKFGEVEVQDRAPTGERTEVLPAFSCPNTLKVQHLHPLQERFQQAVSFHGVALARIREKLGGEHIKKLGRQAANDLPALCELQQLCMRSDVGQIYERPLPREEAQSGPERTPMLCDGLADVCIAQQTLERLYDLGLVERDKQPRGQCPNTVLLVHHLGHPYRGRHNELNEAQHAPAGLQIPWQSDDVPTPRVVGRYGEAGHAYLNEAIWIEASDTLLRSVFLDVHKLSNPSMHFIFVFDVLY